MNYYKIGFEKVINEEAQASTSQPKYDDDSNHQFPVSVKNLITCFDRCDADNTYNYPKDGISGSPKCAINADKTKAEAGSDYVYDFDEDYKKSLGLSNEKSNLSTNKNQSGKHNSNRKKRNEENLLGFSSDSDVVDESDDEGKLAKMGAQENSKKGKGEKSTTSTIDNNVIMQLLNLKPEECKKAGVLLTHVESTDCLFKNIESYVKNSHGLGKKVKAELLDLYKYEDQENLAKPSKSNPLKINSSKTVNRYNVNLIEPSIDGQASRGSESASNKFKMLLWYNCTQMSLGQILIHGLKCGRDVNHLVFYDRFSKVVDQFQPEDRLYCLCEVAVGKMYKSPHGTNTWRNRKLPTGYDSVKSTGEIKPNWEKNQEFKGAAIPCGEDQRNLQFPRYFIEKNEYIIFDARQVSVQFIANVRFTK